MREQMQRPATVSSIEIHGATNTRKSFLDPLLKPVVDAPRNAGTTLGDVLQNLQEVTSKLQRFGRPRPCSSPGKSTGKKGIADNLLRRCI
jgi:hypothetical protein